MTEAKKVERFSVEELSRLIRQATSKTEAIDVCDRIRALEAELDSKDAQIKALVELLKPDCWQPYQADESSQSYSEPDECLDDYYNDREGLVLGDIVFIEAVCIRKQKWQLKEHANHEEGDGPMFIMLDDGLPKSLGLLNDGA